MSDEPRRKLIEVALPLEAINRESVRDKNPFLRGHPRSLHVWWARRPLPACRAVLFASLVDDPSSRPDLYSEEAATRERSRLFRLIEELIRWDSGTDARVLEEAKEEIRRSTDGCPPTVLDPFCGGGAIPLEAQRLGLDVQAADLNPVAVLITKALIEIPPKFKGKPPINPGASETLDAGGWRWAQGLAEDVRYYGSWMRDQAAKRIGQLYPTAQLADGSETAAAAWIWARTVRCPNPACGATMPLVRSFALSTKKGRRAWLRPLVHRADKTIGFEVQTGQGEAPEGTVNRRGAHCLVCREPVAFEYLRSESRSGRMGQRLLAVVADANGGRAYMAPDERHESLGLDVSAAWRPDGEIADYPGHTNVYRYGLTTWGDLFTDRQLVALGTFTDLVAEVRERVRTDAEAQFTPDTAGDYADAVATLLGLGVSRFTDFCNSICSWDSGNANLRQLFSRQAIPMAWDFVETNPLYGVVTVETAAGWIAQALERLRGDADGAARQLDAAAAVNGVSDALVCTDPPYYDNIAYADLSDFFYVWLRRSLRDLYPDLFSTVLTPKSQELVAVTHRFNGDKSAARNHFETGLGEAFKRMHEAHSPEYPLTLFYAFKQTESDGDGLASTGWETMLEALLGAGFSVTGTWPMRTEQQQRSVAAKANALASSIVVVCRRRPVHAPLASRKEFVAALHAELPDALSRLQSGSIAPVDLSQAAIGPGMAVFSRYSKVVEADGNAMGVRTALTLINEALDQLLSEQEADFDADTRWCVAWFEQHGMNDGPFGVAETLSRAKNTAIDGLVEAGVVRSRGGKVRLLDRAELEETWDPATDPRLTVWEVTQHLIARHQNAGEDAAAELLRQVGGGLGEAARELAYRLFSICERKSWAQEALAYNALVSAWPEITRLAAQAAHGGGRGEQESMEV